MLLIIHVLPNIFLSLVCGIGMVFLKVWLRLPVVLLDGRIRHLWKNRKWANCHAVWPHFGTHLENVFHAFWAQRQWVVVWGPLNWPLAWRETWAASSDHQLLWECERGCSHVRMWALQLSGQAASPLILCLKIHPRRGRHMLAPRYGGALACVPCYTHLDAGVRD